MLCNAAATTCAMEAKQERRPACQEAGAVRFLCLGESGRACQDCDWKDERSLCHVSGPLEHSDGLASTHRSSRIRMEGSALAGVSVIVPLSLFVLLCGPVEAPASGARSGKIAALGCYGDGANFCTATWRLWRYTKSACTALTSFKTQQYVELLMVDRSQHRFKPRLASTVYIQP